MVGCLLEGGKDALVVLGHSGRRALSTGMSYSCDHRDLEVHPCSSPISEFFGNLGTQVQQGCSDILSLCLVLGYHLNFLNPHPMTQMGTQRSRKVPSRASTSDPVKCPVSLGQQVSGET